MQHLIIFFTVCKFIFSAKTTSIIIIYKTKNQLMREIIIEKEENFFVCQNCIFLQLISGRSNFYFCCGNVSFSFIITSKLFIVSWLNESPLSRIRRNLLYGFLVRFLGKLSCRNVLRQNFLSFIGFLELLAFSVEILQTF